MTISASPTYWSCPECGNSEFWILTAGGVMCADWPDCGARFDSAEVVAEYHERARREQAAKAAT